MSNSENAPDLDILDPDIQIEINGEMVTVREYRFLEGLQVQSFGQEFLRELTALFLDHPDKVAELEALDELFSAHAHILPELISRAIDKPREWVAALNDADGQLLLITWWQANAQFFMRRLVGAAAARLGQKAAADQIGGISPLN